jgi:hypothetical protein
MSERTPHTNGSTITSLPTTLDRRRRRGKPAAREATHSVVLRVPAHLLARLDSAVDQRSVRVPRHTWILEAIAEKLARELPEPAPAVRGRRHGA